MRPHWMLLELGLEYEFHPIGSRTGETLTAEFMLLNPRHKIPVLRHGSFVMTESAAIIQYVSATFSNGDLTQPPPDAERPAPSNTCSYFLPTHLLHSSPT